MEVITKSDLSLINDLSSRPYSDNRLLSNATEIEKENLNRIKTKLKNLAKYFSAKYYKAYGPFEVSVVTGNDIAIRGTKLKRIWSGIFKGASNKQYAAQISFVMDPEEPCLNVGFYFGSASGHSVTRDQRIELESRLADLGVSLSKAITQDQLFRNKYDSLFDFGFNAFSDGIKLLGDDWCNKIQTHTKNSHIIAKIYPNDFDVIENSTIDLYVSEIVFLMGGISEIKSAEQSTINPLTPEQRAKHAERMAQIGLSGELFVMKIEKSKLASIMTNNKQYPKHVALESNSFGYDVLSLGESGEEIYIEVKSTTRPKNDKNSRQFFLSAYEFEIYSANKPKYKLYRVYDVENNPSIEVLDLGTVSKNPDGYLCKY